MFRLVCLNIFYLCEVENELNAKNSANHLKCFAKGEVLY